jgi:cellulose synthase/poly-beta-1,6-N-acetylglucosamine synthase-like glycosyltransferase
MRAYFPRMGPASILILSLALVVYAYAGYPALCWARARLWPRPIERRPIRPRVSIIIAAWREARVIERKLIDLARQTYPAQLIEIVVACDGSDDGTPELAARAGARLDGRLRVIALDQLRGKAAALDAAVAVARGELLVFTDARQLLAPRAIEALVECFADREVGAVGGELVLAGDEPAGLYWRYEAALRRWESASGSTIGLSGALYALRRELWRPLPPETILDDVLVPMRARLAGKRVVLEPLAQVYDQAAPLPHEFRRKARTLSGNFQLLALEPRLLSPLHDPSWLALISHKLLRLAVPWALVIALLASAALPEPWRALLLAAQLAGYGLAAARWLGAGRGSRLARLCETMVVLNAAAVVGTVRFLRYGRRLQW